MPVQADRLVTRGGPVAAVQIDNEVGMLSWVTSTPELTDCFLADLASHLDERLGLESVVERPRRRPKDAEAWARCWSSGAPAAPRPTSSRCTTS